MTSPQEALQKAREQDGGWIEHDGKGLPVDGEALVWVMLDDGTTDEHNMAPEKASWWQGGVDSWSPDAWPRVVAYRLHTPAPSSSEEKP